MKVINQTSGEEVASSVKMATTFLQRLAGWIPLDNIETGQGLLLKPCTSIHTFMMKSSIDVLYLNEECYVVGMEEELPPNKLGKRFRDTAQVLELAPGTLSRCKVNLHDRLVITSNDQ